MMAEARHAQGLTLDQAAAATRIRSGHLNALESGGFDRLPAPVYALGYSRTYARFLGLDPDAVVAGLALAPHDARRSMSLVAMPMRPRLTLTGPLAAVAACVLLGAGFVFYAGRQIESVQRTANLPPASAPGIAAATPGGTPTPAPTPQPKPIVVGVRVTDDVWLDVVVDGKSLYSDAGRILPAGSEVYFTGLDVKITSGKAAATFITIDDRSLGALGNGVATREFTSH
jgi:cytoskeleton protein RodZ